MKKRTGVVIAFLAMSILSCMHMSAFAQAKPNFTYVISNGEAEITGCDFDGKMLNIPNTVEGSPVTGIASGAFSNLANITDATVPNSVVNIGEGAFSGCKSLQKITLPFVGSSRDASGTRDAVFGYIFGKGNCLQVYSGVGSDNYNIPDALKEINITDATLIPYGAFYGLGGVRDISLNAGISLIGLKAFCECNSLQNLYVYSQSAKFPSKNIFDNCEWLTVYAGKGSTAEVYANTFGIDFTDMESVSESPANCYTLTGNMSVVSDHIVVEANLSKKVNGAKVHVALYDADGRLLDYVIVPKFAAYDNASVVFENNENVKYAKIFLLDELSAIEPIAEAVKLELGGGSASGEFGMVYNVVFDLNYEDRILSMQKVEEGNNATAPKNPTRQGYSFIGWAIDKDGTQMFDFNTKITQTTTLYAIWKDHCIVDGTLVDPATTTCEQLSIRKDRYSTITTKYKLTNNVKTYINGVEVDLTSMGWLDPAKLCAALDQSTGDTLLHESDTQPEYYDAIMFNCYLTAEVSEVTVRSDEVRVTLKSLAGYGKINSGTIFTVTDDEIADGDVEVSVTRNGEAAELASLEKGDVVSILYDAATSLDDSSFLTILATNETVTGRFVAYDDEDGIYTIGDKDYEAVVYNLGILVGSTYKCKLDVFGKLFSADEESTADTYAIVEKYVDTGSSIYEGSETNDYIVVKTLDGQEKTVYIDSAVKLTTRCLMEGIYSFIGSTLRLDNNNVAIKDRIIRYQTKKNGYINKIALATDVVAVEGKNYVEASNRLGKALSSSAKILDASDYVSAYATDKRLSDIKASSLSSLKDGKEYDAILVNRNSYNEYMYVIITKNGNIYDGSSNFAVVAANASLNSRGHSDVADEDCYKITAMYEGEMQTLEIADTAIVNYNGNSNQYYNVANYMKQGTVFFFTTDSDGLIDEIDVVANSVPFGEIMNTDSTTLWGNSVAMPDSSKVAAGSWLATFDDDDNAFTGDENIQLIYAPIYTAKSSSISVAPVVSASPSYMDCNSVYDYLVSPDAYIYSYDMSGRVTGKRAFSAGGAFAGVSARDADVNNYIYFGQHYGEVDYSDKIQFAFLMVVDGVVTNAVVMNN